jgi:hypothetical protein
MIDWFGDARSPSGKHQVDVLCWPIHLHRMLHRLIIGPGVAPQRIWPHGAREDSRVACVMVDDSGATRGAVEGSGAVCRGRCEGHESRWHPRHWEMGRICKGRESRRDHECRHGHLISRTYTVERVPGNRGI